MNISNKLRQNYVFPAAGFIPFPETHGYLIYSSPAEASADALPSLQSDLHGLGTDKYGESLKNPQTFREVQHNGGVSNDFFIPLSHVYNGVADRAASWRIDGATFGVQYWAVPDFMLPMPPLRIDVFIPDQTEWPAETWSALDARDSTHMSDRRVAELGIARHLSLALEIWCERNPHLEEEYRKLPFGSSIKVPAIKVNVAEMEFIMTPNIRLQDSMLSVAELQSMWGFEATRMPLSISINELHFRRQLQKSISLVTVVPDNETPMILKSRTRTMSGLYHEVKVLLTIPPHQNIIERPQYLVTTFCPVHKEHRVCGFLLKYHEAGALQEALPQRLDDGALRLGDQVRWAKEVTTALLHIHETPGQFYSDLKMDNVLLSWDGEREIAILADFEQSRNFYNWAPPEIYYVEWIAELGNPDVARTKSIDPQTVAKFSKIFERYLTNKGHSSIRTQGFKYDNPAHGWYFPWLLSTPEEQEAGEVYCLGKVLWCIFEGIGDVDNVLGRSIPFTSPQRFPEFRRTPEALRPLIKSCTTGAREWKNQPIGIFRKEGRVFPLRKTGENGEPEGTLDETERAIKTFWQGEMDRAAAFMSAKEKFDMGKADDEDLDLLDYLRRPKLKQVLETLQNLATSAL